ncbi:MotA/TolQ/ExbB proton channel family protein [Vibrio sp. ZSDE26]|uniref:MotA/TolQ/ExbB proton channel family protein n=1 Tax=Vibrio amylolyticus TaxID=2847292 RepID=A0A9X1XET1_9VIBR|nr:MotA/TolQ/ExbB proton channel family protein [Vibrio amylolyticus]MCK6261672.1 MotA/TolQ/ExbB proton channel family protein [Vibrio amylolyticus]
MKALALTTLMLAGVLGSVYIEPTYAAQEPVQNSLTKKAQADNAKQKKENAQRQLTFIETEDKLKKRKAELEAKRNFVQNQTDELAKTFSSNEDKLARLEENLRLETGSLGELFGVVRQVAKELEPQVEESVTAIDANAHSAYVDSIIKARTLPSMDELTGLWRSLNEQIKASAQLSPVDVSIVNSDGKATSQSAFRIGSFALVGDLGYLKWNSARDQAVYYANQPSQVPDITTLTLYSQDDEQQSTDNAKSWQVDPSRGVILSQRELEPTLKDRLEAAGVVGKVILGLLAIGLFIALYRGITLSVAQVKIRKQLKKPQQIGNNPLGRILSVYNKENTRTVEALELRLLEAVVDEQTHLEKGLSMLKLFAALAPMLGLLGTVTGMIETFQVITHFGNGDPKVMAGGISMALMTTVLGLVAAMPLLLAHNLLSTQAENIRNILEKQGIGLVAQQAERDDTIDVFSKQPVAQDNVLTESPA